MMQHIIDYREEYLIIKGMLKRKMATLTELCLITLLNNNYVIDEDDPAIPLLVKNIEYDKYISKWKLKPIDCGYRQFISDIEYIQKKTGNTLDVICREFLRINDIEKTIAHVSLLGEINAIGYTGCSNDPWEYLYKAETNLCRPHSSCRIL